MNDVYRNASELSEPEKVRQAILLVDDRVENLVALEAILDDGSLLLLRAQSGEEALQILLEHEVALVLLDVAMPGMDGYEVASLMRSSRRTRNIPIIFITAFLRDDMSMQEGYQRGAIDYLLKPVNSAILRCKVAIFLELDRRQRLLQHAYNRLDSQRAFYQSILDAAAEGVIGINAEGYIVFSNPAAARILQLEAGHLLRQPLARFLVIQDEGGWETHPCRSVISLKEEWRDDDAEFVNGKGQRFPASYSCSPLAGSDAGAVLVFQDITQRKALEEQLRLLALTDHLTGLCNRNGFKTALSKSLERNKRTNKHIAIMFIDLDHFKQVNDTLGHDAGDALLQSVAAELKASVRSNDTVARLGGDEFTVILEDLEAPEDCALIARKILAALRRPLSAGTQHLDIIVGASIGIATYPGCGNDAGSLMQAADVAMYRAKTDGRNGYQFFTPEMNAKAEARLMLEQSLRKALDQRELSLYYQAQIDIRDNRIVGLEALMRWQHPEAGLVSPAVFVPLLEETGLIMSVGPWVIEEACAQRARWRESGLLTDDCHLAINISARQFRDHSLLAELRRCLNKYGLAPGMIEIELTEGSLMQDTDLARRILSELRRMGIGLAVDDFGTGYSSLSYLKQFELDVLKIDKSFVEQITENPKDAALAASIIALAHNLGLGVVAEGVETAEQLALLQQQGCEVVQGFYFARPLPASEVELLLGSWPRPTA